MLYQDKTLGQASIGRRIAAAFALLIDQRKRADYELLAQNAWLRRDVGIEGDTPSRDSVWRK
jgi:hypothetical protein